MPVCTPTTISHVIDVMTLTAETTTTAFASAGAEDEAADAKREPSHAVSGKWRALAWPSRPGVAPRRADSRARRATTHAHTMRTTHSTKRACQRVDPRKREASPWGEESRGWGFVRREGTAGSSTPIASAAVEAARSGSSLDRAASAGEPLPAVRRTAMRTTIPASPAHAKASVTHSQGMKCPRSGSAHVWSRSCAYPETRVRNSRGKDIMTSQWAALTHGRPLNSRWVSAVVTTPQRRRPTGRRRPGSGVPEATVRHMCARPRANATSAIAVTSSANAHIMALSVGSATGVPPCTAA